MTADHLELYSARPPEECARALAASVDEQRAFLFSFASIWGSRPVIGRVTGLSFRLRKRIAYSNSFQIGLTATMEPAGSGTLIRGTFAMHPFTRVFMRIWFGGVLFFCVIVTVLLAARLAGFSEGTGNDWPFLLIPFGMLGFGWALVRYGGFLARDEQRFLTEFLKSTLDAREPDQAAAGNEPGRFAEPK